MANEIQEALDIVPGKLCIGATDLSLDFPHGGQSLGEVMEILIDPVQTFTLIPGEAQARPLAGIDGGRAWVLTAIMRGDPDALLDAVFSTVAGTVSQDSVVSDQQDALTGTVFDPATNLVFSPEDLDHHRVLVFKQHFLFLDEAERLRSALREPMTIGIVAAAAEDDVLWGMRDDPEVTV